MTDLPQRVDVVVVGAGLAGLRAATVLERSGLSVVVVERSDAVGGRVRSDRVDGLVLDRGFQVLNPAYPEARRALDLAALDLHELTAGLVFAEGTRRHRVADPRRRPGWAIASLLAPTGSPVTNARFVAYAVATSRASMTELRARPDVSASEALSAAGVRGALLESVVSPFLAGVFLEDGLATSRRFLDVVLRSFLRGTPGLPAHGMQAVPEQLAAALAPGSLRLGVEATAVAPGRVTTSEGEVGARAVVVAVDGRAAARLVPAVAAPLMRDVTTWYHLADCAGTDLLDGEPVLLVDAQRRGPVVNSVVVSSAAPSYASGGRVLVSSSALGTHDDAARERQVREHLATLYGVPTRGWTHVATYAVRDALPVMAPPFALGRDPRLGDGLYVCGDHRATSSIQGALVSGRHAAEAVLADLAGTG